ncbi:TPA: hypothetical protein N0F65_005372, partial [Lagenidium giganteum]
QHCSCNRDISLGLGITHGQPQFASPAVDGANSTTPLQCTDHQRSALTQPQNPQHRSELAAMAVHSSSSPGGAGADLLVPDMPSVQLSDAQQQALLLQARGQAAALVVDTLHDFEKWQHVTDKKNVRVFELRPTHVQHVATMVPQLAARDPAQLQQRMHTLLAKTRVRAKLDDFMRIMASHRIDVFQNVLTCLHKDRVQYADVFASFHAADDSDMDPPLPEATSASSSSSTTEQDHPATAPTDATVTEHYTIKYYTLRNGENNKSLAGRASLAGTDTERKSKRQAAKDLLKRSRRRQTKSIDAADPFGSDDDSNKLTALCVGEYATIRAGQLRPSNDQNQKENITDERVGIISWHSIEDSQVTRCCPSAPNTLPGRARAPRRTLLQFSGLVVYPVASSRPGESILEVVCKMSVFDAHGVPKQTKQALLAHMLALQNLENALLVMRLRASRFLTPSNWVHDSQRKCCAVCQQSFKAFRRRKHHCRLCGEITCSKCSPVQSVKFATAGKCELRICSQCTDNIDTSNPQQQQQHYAEGCIADDTTSPEHTQVSNDTDELQDFQDVHDAIDDDIVVDAEVSTDDMQSEYLSTTAPMIVDLQQLEACRQQRLLDYAIFDSPREYAFDQLARQAAQELGCVVASVSFVDGSREYLKASHGIHMICDGLNEVPKQHSLAAYMLRRFAVAQTPASGVETVLDMHKDVVLCSNQFVYAAPYLRFVAGVPITSMEDGMVLGVLLVADQNARSQLTATEIQSLQMLGLEASKLMHERLQQHPNGAPRTEAGAQQQHQMRNTLAALLSKTYATQATVQSFHRKQPTSDDDAVSVNCVVSEMPSLRLTDAQQHTLLAQARDHAAALVVNAIHDEDKWQHVTRNKNVQVFELRPTHVQRVGTVAPLLDPVELQQNTHTLLAKTRVHAKLDEFMRVMASHHMRESHDMLLGLHGDRVQYANVLASFQVADSTSANTLSSQTPAPYSSLSSPLSTSSDQEHHQTELSVASASEQYAIKYYTLRNDENEMMPSFAKLTLASAARKNRRQSSKKLMLRSRRRSIKSIDVADPFGGYDGSNNLTALCCRIGIISWHSIEDAQVTRCCPSVEDASPRTLGRTQAPRRTLLQFSGLVVCPVPSSRPGESILEVVCKMSVFDAHGVAKHTKQALLAHMLALQNLENALLVMRLRASRFLSPSNWVHDSQRKCCAVCQQSFKAFRRRKHHCRLSPYLRFVAGVPITSMEDGMVLGVLLVADQNARSQLTATEIQSLQMLGLEASKLMHERLQQHPNGAPRTEAGVQQQHQLRNTLVALLSKTCAIQATVQSLSRKQPTSKSSDTSTLSRSLVE